MSPDEVQEFIRRAEALEISEEKRNLLFEMITELAQRILKEKRNAKQVIIILPRIGFWTFLVVKKGNILDVQLFKNSTQALDGLPNHSVDVTFIEDTTAFYERLGLPYLEITNTDIKIKQVM